MKPTDQKHSALCFAKWLCASVTLLMLYGCIALLTPTVKKEVYQLREGQYALDPEHTTVLFKVSHLGLSTYVGRFNESKASLDFDPTSLTSTRLSAVVKTASIDVNNTDLEERLRGSSWFNSETFPEAIFKTLSVKPSRDNNFIFTGELTLLDTTRTLELHGTFHGGATNFLTGKYTLGFSALGTFKRSEFGLDQYIPLVGDDIAIEVYAEFQKQ